MVNKNIHQILILDEYNKESTDLIKHNQDAFKSILPDYKYNYWDKESITSLLKENFDPKVLNAFNALKAYAYKSDLARLCILYVHGGWYVDVHTEAYYLPDPREQYIVFRDRDFVTKSKNTISNSLMYFKANHELLMGCINKIIENIDNRYYGDTPYCPTGPNLVGSIVLESRNSNGNGLIGYCTDLDNGKPSPTFGYYYFLPDNTRVGIAKNENSKFLNLPGYQNYRLMWDQKNIYFLFKKMKEITINEYPCIYINMDDGVVKNKKMQRTLKHDCGFSDIKRIKGGIGKDKIHGVSIGHYDALSKSSYPVIVFEDDCEVLSYVNTIEVPEDADALYLGVMPWGMKNGEAIFNAIEYQQVNSDSDIYRVYNLLGAHAILYLSERFFNFAKEQCRIASISGEPQDVLLANSHNDFNIYAVGMPMFYQSGYYEQQTNKHILEYFKYTHEDLTKDFNGVWSRT